MGVQGNAEECSREKEQNPIQKKGKALFTRKPKRMAGEARALAMHEALNSDPGTHIKSCACLSPQCRGEGTRWSLLDAGLAPDSMKELSQRIQWNVLEQDAWPPRVEVSIPTNTHSKMEEEDKEEEEEEEERRVNKRIFAW
jgi:hypothetical protein